MCELTREALDADSKPIALLTPAEHIQRIEIQLEMIDAMVAETRAEIERYKREHPSCQS
jgi:hypothetical protein